LQELDVIKAALHAPPAHEPAQAVDFYIPATGPSARARRTLKSGDTFAVVDSHGDIGASAGGPDGVFQSDTRYLSRFELLFNGLQLLLLGSNVSDDNSVLTVDLTNPDIYFEKKLTLPKDTLHIVRTLFLWNGAAYQRFGIRNHGDTRVSMRLSMTFGSDFADLFEVRGVRRQRRGLMETLAGQNGDFLFRYQGLDGRIRRTALRFDPAPTELVSGVASYALDLAPGERCSIFVAVECDHAEEKARANFFSGMIKASRERRQVRATTVETSNDIFNQILCRSQADLRMLTTQTPQGAYPYAGIPWYSTTFGRDGLITALQMLWCDPGMARGVLRRLAAYQAMADDAPSDAQPGKILHEMREGEMAALHEVPFGLYYGSVDSTPLFVLLAGAYVERTGDTELLQELWPHIEAALAWIDGPADPDRDGFLEYFRATEKGLANQGWKDSHDAIFHADGRLAEGPIALVEVQGYVYTAKVLAARCARRMGQVGRAEALERQAKELAARFEEKFWCPEIGTYALALDGQKRQCAVRTSNAGQVLFTGIAPSERAIAVAASLMRPSFFSGWGIRTVSREESRYNPMSYHNGSVWPHDNALIALGFARYGLQDGVARMFGGLFDAARYMDLYRLPELFCGFQRGRGRGPTLYPVACAPQAWAAATPFALLQASLGIWFNPAQKQIQLHNPRLPPFLDEVVLRNLRLGGSSVDLLLGRRGTDVSLQVLRRDGQIEVSAIHT
jgi:glycogen debranching enzyme